MRKQVLVVKFGKASVWKMEAEMRELSIIYFRKMSSDVLVGKELFGTSLSGGYYRC
jgi:hypothetical protein